MKKDLQCKECICPKFTKQGDLITHLKKEHDIQYEQYVLKYFFGSVYPTCKCGCGTIMQFRSYGDYFFAEYTKNHWPHKKHTEETKERIKINYKKALLEKYGVDNPMALKACRDKILQTKEEKYGDPGYNNMEKNKQTKSEKYGDENYNNPEQIIKTNIEKYGAHSFTSTEEGKLQVKKTKKEKYGDEKYNNYKKNAQTKLDRYGYESEFSNPEWRKKYNGKNTKIEKIVADELGGEHKFIYAGKEYDIRFENTIIEIDGESFHPGKLENLHLIQLANSMNDYKKTIEIINRQEYEYLKIPVSKIDRKSDITLDYLKSISYVQNFDLSYYQKAMTKETLKKYIDKKGKNNLSKYSKVFLNFIKTFQPEFPKIETNENLSDVIRVLREYEYERIRTKSGDFKNNISSVGTSYLKSKFNSYWNSAYKGKETPKEVWSNLEMMKRVIEYRIGLNDSNEIYDFSLHQLVRGISAIRHTISFFKPLLAAGIYKEFIGDKYNPIVLDPCAGFGGRMLGFKSLYPNGTYIGVEPNFETFSELADLAANFSNIQLFNCKIEDLDISTAGNIDLTFTSIPYYDLEIYSSVVQYYDYDDWSNKFLNKIKSLPNLLLNIPKSLRKEFSECTEYKIISNTSHFDKNQTEKYEYLLKF